MIRRRQPREKPKPHEIAVMEEIYAAWVNPGISPQYHDRMRIKVRAFMPTLARHLDELARIRGDQK